LCAVLGAGLGDHLAKLIDVPQHVIEMLGGALKLRTISLPVEEIRRAMPNPSPLMP
jgi:hypothetical protein